MTGGIPRLFETMRVHNGGVPFARGHANRLRASSRALGLASPPDIADLAAIRAAALPADHVLRVSWDGRALHWSDRPFTVLAAPRVVVVRSRHRGYPHKLVERSQFDAAMREARSRGAEEPLLCTSRGYLAEGARFGVVWLDGGVARTPALSLGILPSIGVWRLQELAQREGIAVEQGTHFAEALVGCPAALVNAVQGIVPIGWLDGGPVPGDERWRAWAAVFWAA
ncbi:MAG TPA: aminotransferase class IV [Gemmatimonadales bacterium]